MRIYSSFLLLISVLYLVFQHSPRLAISAGFNHVLNFSSNYKSRFQSSFSEYFYFWKAWIRTKFISFGFLLYIARYRCLNRKKLTNIILVFGDDERFTQPAFHPLVVFRQEVELVYDQKLKNHRLKKSLLRHWSKKPVQ